MDISFVDNELETTNANGLVFDNNALEGAKITVFGVGGGGGNAVNTMINSGVKGVKFIAANTDMQALYKSAAETRIQLGKKLTRGLGAGAKPEVGKGAAEESLEEIREAIGDSDMVFVTAGMGGGTGTGAAPIVAKVAKEKNALTVGVVTKPFQHEAARRMRIAEQGIQELTEYVDSLIIIPNNRLLNSGSKSAKFLEMMAKADEVLCCAVCGITELITSEGNINTDFADVATVMSEKGMALMGIGRATGEQRAIEAAKGAIASPLLEDISIQGARGVIVNIKASEDVLLEEIELATSYITDSVAPDAIVITGLVTENSVGEEFIVTVIATGLDQTAKKISLPGDTKSSTPTLDYAQGRQVQNSYVQQAPQAQQVQPRLANLASNPTRPYASNANNNDRETPAYLRRGQTAQAHIASNDDLVFSFTNSNAEVPTFIRKQVN